MIRTQRVLAHTHTNAGCIRARVRSVGIFVFGRFWALVKHSAYERMEATNAASQIKRTPNQIQRAHTQAH